MELAHTLQPSKIINKNTQSKNFITIMRLERIEL